METFVRAYLWILLSRGVLVYTQSSDNIAFQKTTVQDGVLHYPDSDASAFWYSRHAVDGMKECPEIADCIHYSGTAIRETPWWQVDLGAAFSISNITIFGRPTSRPVHLQRFQVHLSVLNHTTSSNIVYNNTEPYGNGIFTDIITPGKVYYARYVTIVLPRNEIRRDSGPLVLCEVEVYGTHLPKRTFDIAPNVEIHASTVLRYGSNNYSEINVIDQAASSHPDDCNCCWSSANEINPWLNAVMPYSVPVLTIHVIGRRDSLKTTEYRSLQGLKVQVDSIMVPNEWVIYNVTNNVVTVYPTKSLVKNITLTRPAGTHNEWYFIICEIQIDIRSCDNGHYGFNCTASCNKKCKQSTPTCNTVTGVCTQGCKAGYNGSHCTQSCGPGHYGENCANMCHHCLSGTHCDGVTGNCPNGCNPGFKGTKCNITCGSGHYGENCVKICHHCLSGTYCEGVNGNCPAGCDRGFTGTKCNIGCENGHYGFKCNSSCNGNCKKGIPTCNKETGVCTQGCKAGYHGSHCTQPCGSGRYGEDCKTLCGHCLSRTVCNGTTGICPAGCNPGFRRNKCDTTCANGMYGKNCENLCHCLNSASCIKTNGSCQAGCDIMWTGPYCSEDKNLIRHIEAKTYQSGTFLNNTNYNASKAIDGIEEYSVDSCGCCSVATGGSSSWWMIDLGNQYLIAAVEIFGRSDGISAEQLDTAKIYAGNYTLDSNGTPGYVIYTVPRPSATKFIFLKELSTSIIAQKFLVHLNKNAMTLCEFKLLEKECHVGYYGNGCAWRCNCMNDTKCDAVTGHCIIGECHSGWQGDTCDQVCDEKTFGKRCNKTCNCFNSTHCNPINGECDIQKCDPGWEGLSCSKPDGIIPLLADSVQTRMSSVASNRTSDLAIDGKIGPDPDQCKCCSETNNSQLSWWLVDFGQAIPISKVIVYSRNKENEFHHLNGFQLSVSKDFLYNSSSFKSSDTPTSSKIFQITLPNILSRQIKIQRPGVLTLCEVQVYKGECETGTFGNGCSQNCHCADNQPCNQITGFCQTAACKTGWRGQACEKNCLPGTFGDECKEDCFCEVGTCTSNYGICTGKCRPGYHGPHCNQVGTETHDQTEQQTDIGYSTAAVVGGGVGGSAALIIVIVVVGIVIFRFRKQGRSTSKSYYDSPNSNITPTESPDYDTLDNLNDIQRSSNGDYENETVTGF